MNWYNPSWRYRKRITISGSSGAGTNYPVLLKVGESYSTWRANTHYSVGNLVKPTAGSNNFFYECIYSGVSWGSEPTWPTTDGEIVIDRNTEWIARRGLTLDGRSANFPADIRFTASDGLTLQDFWVEKVTGTPPNRVAYIWVKVSADLGSDQNIYCYYGSPGATSLSNGDAVFVFFDDFLGTSLDTNTWVAYSDDYGVSNSHLNVAKGGIERTSAFSFNIQDGYIAETSVIHFYHGHYHGGVFPSVASSPYTEGGNANADATILYMRGQNTVSVYYSIGNGASSSFNVASYQSAEWAAANDVRYTTGISVRGGEVKLWRNGTAMVTRTGITWYKNLKYVKLGSFLRNNTYNIQHTYYDWIRIRKYVSPEPAISLAGSEETFNPSPFFLFFNN